MTPQQQLNEIKPDPYGFGSPGAKFRRPNSEFTGVSEAKWLRKTRYEKIARTRKENKLKELGTTRPTTLIIKDHKGRRNFVTASGLTRSLPIEAAKDFKEMIEEAVRAYEDDRSDTGFLKRFSTITKAISDKKRLISEELRTLESTAEPLSSQSAGASQPILQPPNPVLRS